MYFFSEMTVLLPTTKPFTVSNGLTTFQKFLLSVANEKFKFVSFPFYTICCNNLHVFICLKKELLPHVLKYFVSRNHLLIITLRDVLDIYGV